MHAQANFYLALAETNRPPYMTARITTKRPTLKPGEVMMQLSVRVPRALFERPVLRASIEVAGDVSAPVVTAQMQDDIATALSTQLGVRVHVTADGEG